MPAHDLHVEQPQDQQDQRSGQHDTDEADTPDLGEVLRHGWLLEMLLFEGSAIGRCPMKGAVFGAAVFGAAVIESAVFEAAVSPNFGALAGGEYRAETVSTFGTSGSVPCTHAGHLQEYGGQDVRATNIHRRRPYVRALGGDERGGGTGGGSYLGCFNWPRKKSLARSSSGSPH